MACSPKPFMSVALSEREPSARHSSQQIQGRRQAVRQQVLILPCVGSNPAAPAIFHRVSRILLPRVLRKQLIQT